MAADGEVVLRQRVCGGTGDSGCHAVFWICQHCDRGQRYCSLACRLEARRCQRRSANSRHQRSPEGRLDHRDRQRAYRHRAQAPVTDQGSLSIPSPASSGCGTFRAIPIQPRFPREPEKRAGLWLRCRLCGRGGRFVDPFPPIPKRK